MNTRKSYYVKPGNFKNLKIKEENLGDPNDNEVQVEVKSIGLNFADVFCVLGLYDAAPDDAFIPGLEFSGVVKQVGSEVSKLKQGDKVMGVTRFGAYTSLINIDAGYVMDLPEDWTFDDGSAYLVQALTAYYGLVELGNLSSQMNILIHSAAGGVGIWANRICKQYDCFTIGTVGRSSKIDLLKSEGYDSQLVRNVKTFGPDLKDALEGRPLHLIMDSIGGTILKDGYKILAPMGRLVTFGSAHYGERKDRPNYPKLIWKYLRRPKIDPQTMIGYNKSVMGFNLVYLFDQVHLMHIILEKLSAMNLGKPIISKKYPFESLPEALREFQSGRTTGKLVINV